MTDLLFDTPIWLLAVLLVAGAALWWSGNNRQDRTLKIVGLLVLVAGLGLGVLSWLIDTDKESVTRKTRQIVASVQARDWTTLQTLLDARTSFAWYHNRDELIAGARATTDRIGLKSARVLGMDVQQKDTVITVDFKAYSDQDITAGRPVLTEWRFDWQNHGTGWKLTTITPLKSPQVNVDQIMAHLARINH